MIKGRREVVGAAAVAHVHADNVAPCGPGAGTDAEDVAGVRRALEAVDQDQGETTGSDRLRLPMAVAEYAARIGGVDFDCFSCRGEAQGRAGIEVADDGLQMAAGQAAAGDELWKSRGKPCHSFVRL